MQGEGAHGRVAASKHHRSLRKLIGDHPGAAEREEIFFRLSKYDDQAAAIMGVALLDNTLQTAILVKLVQPNTGLFDGPLSSFAAKIKLAFALGLYGPETRDDLDLMRAIRNTFAHSAREVTFATPEIEAACNAIQFMKGPGVEAKDKYVVTVGFFVFGIMNYAQPSPLMNPPTRLP